MMRKKLLFVILNLITRLIYKNNKDFKASIIIISCRNPHQEKSPGYDGWAHHRGPGQAATERRAPDFCGC